MKMGLREANQNFSKAIKAIKAGKTIVLTERGTPIATIQPISGRAYEKNELQLLRDEGFFVQRDLSRSPSTAKPLRILGVSLSKALRMERDEE
jgi:prevent-host-death family protein